LQVGLSPVEETDQELLNIANKEKLQVRIKERKSLQITFCISHH
jgi:PHD/YefM family antitoxin component YafN of YafNO toxin-antitoxin module